VSVLRQCFKEPTDESTMLWRERFVPLGHSKSFRITGAWDQLVLNSELGHFPVVARLVLSGRFGGAYANDGDVPIVVKARLFDCLDFLR